MRRGANISASTFSQSDLLYYFGLATRYLVDLLRVVWPGGSIETISNAAVIQYITVVKQ